MVLSLRPLLPDPVFQSEVGLPRPSWNPSSSTSASWVFRHSPPHPDLASFSISKTKFVGFFFLDHADPYTYIIPKSGELGKNSVTKLIKSNSYICFFSVSCSSWLFPSPVIASLERLHVLPDSRYIYNVCLRKKYTEQFPPALENKSAAITEAQGQQYSAYCPGKGWG